MDLLRQVAFRVVMVQAPPLRVSVQEQAAL